MLRRKKLLAMSDIYRAIHQMGAIRAVAPVRGLLPRAKLAAVIESLECRRLLSVVPLGPVLRAGMTEPIGSLTLPAGWKVTPDFSINPDLSPANLPAPSALTPAQMRGAYGVGQYGSSSVTFSGAQADGSGQTICIVDGYDDPTALSDLNAFSTYYGLPTFNSGSGSTFTKYGVDDGVGLTTTLPGTDPSGAAGKGDNTWEVEESLDIEWSHVMAPKANIVLVEAGDDMGFFDGDYYGAGLTGVVAVSNSWSGDEVSTETSDDPLFTTPIGHVGSGGLSGGVTFLASSGDQGAYGDLGAHVLDPQYPASSPNVLAVGGTALVVGAGNTYHTEVAWGMGSNSAYGWGGGGISVDESQPSWQGSFATPFSATQRCYPDVSLDASSGVAFYDSYDLGATNPWSTVGGTSLSCPMMAGIVAVADQGRNSAGLGSMDGATDTIPGIYRLAAADYATDFHDITSGNNGYAAGVGYDLATGLGSVIASRLIPDLATAGINGRAFVDDLGNGIYGGNDVPVTGKTVYLDLNNDSVLDDSEPSTTTDAQGFYTFATDPGVGTVRLSPPNLAGYIAEPSSAALAGTTADTVNFLYFPTSFATAAPATNYTLQTDYTGTYTQILINSTLSYSIVKSTLGPTPLFFSLTGTGDSFTIDATYGNPIPTGGVTLTGTSSGVAALIDGSQTATDSYVVTSSGVTFDSSPFNFSNVSLLTLNPDNVAPSLSVLSGSVSIQAPRAGGGILTRRFSSINVASGAKLLFASAAASSDRAVVAVSTLSDSGQIDLGANDMVVYGGTVAALFPLLASGYNSGTWSGQGIASAAAAGNTTHLTTLGILSNNSSTGTAIYNSFDYVPVGATAVLVKYTYYGDTNLDGQVDGSDYSLIDNGYLKHLTSWSNGDFNYDVSVNGTDYTLIDNAYNRQGTSLAAQIAGAHSSEKKVDVQTRTGSFAKNTFSTATLTFLGGSDAANMESWLKRKDVLDSLAIMTRITK